jgi:hypothetical protein
MNGSHPALQARSGRLRAPGNGKEATTMPQPNYKPPRPRGRPTKLTPEITKKICDAVSGGNFRYVAARWAGVPIRTLRWWCAQGRKAKKGPMRDFLHALLEAEKAAEIRAVALVMKAAAKDAKHAEWWLERKYPKRWGRKDNQKITVTDERIEAEIERAIKVFQGGANEESPAA